jgi:primase-polymerase (primpol)-like protein
MGENQDRGRAPGAPAPARKHPLNADSWNFPWAAVRRLPLREGLPPELVETPRWLTWAFWHDGKRWAKQPRSHALSGTNIDPTDPANLVTFTEAARAFYESRRYESRDNVRLAYANPRFQLDGIGFAFLKQDPFAGVDLDKCVTPEFDERGRFSYTIDDWAAEVLATFPDCYAELSPSLTGVKVFVAGKLDPGRAGAKFTGLGPTGLSAVEVYDDRRYFTVTGIRLRSHPSALGARGPELNALYARLDAARTPTSGAGGASKASAVPNFRGPSDAGRARSGKPSRRLRELSDGALLDRARRARTGVAFASLYDRGDLAAYNNDHSAADLALCVMLTFWADGDPDSVDHMFRQSALMRPKWDSPRGGSTYGRETVREAIAVCRNRYRG